MSGMFLPGPMKSRSKAVRHQSKPSERLQDYAAAIACVPESNRGLQGGPPGVGPGGPLCKKNRGGTGERGARTKG